MRTCILLLLLIFPGWLYSQQVADTSYHPIIEDPEYESGKGSVIFIDEGHHNFHTKNGRYKAFSTLLERDGYQVKEYKGRFNKKQLAEGKILVISNDKYVIFLPDTAWVFDRKTPVYNVKGWSQGAFKKYGEGRIVVFGEAAMFSAQLAGEQKIKAGMNREDARENYRLLLNIIHWLDGKLD